MATSPQEFKKPRRTWTLGIEPGYGAFQPGPANAVGIVCAMGSEVRVFFWSQEVELSLIGGSGPRSIADIDGGHGR